MAERRTKVGNRTDQSVASHYELLETQVLQAQTSEQLDAALAGFVDQSSAPEDMLAVLQYAGPARVVSLVLRGYELPESETRYVSTKALLQLDTVLQRADRKGDLSEQIWLILAAQQDVLLQQLENDLEALYEATDTLNLRRQRKIVGDVHALLRTRSSDAVSQMLGVGTYA